MKNITKKQSQEFNSKIEKLLLDNGFIFSKEDSFEGSNGVWKVFHKETNFGSITTSLPSQNGGEIFSLFSKFDDICKAVKMFQCNRFTGKYNYHFTKDEGLNGYAFEQINYFMDELNGEIWDDEKGLVEND